MKKLSMILLLTISLLLCSCSTEKTASNTTSESLQSITPTGVSEGQYEQPIMYYQGNLYSYDFSGRPTTLASRYISIGEILEVDMYNIPTEDFYATGVDVQIGQEVYAETTEDPSVVFVDLGNEYLPLYKDTDSITDETPLYVVDVCKQYLSDNEPEDVLSTIINYETPILEIIEELPDAGTYMAVADETGTGPYYTVTFTTTADELLGPIEFIVNQEIQIVGIFYRE